MPKPKLNDRWLQRYFFVGVLMVCFMGMLWQIQGTVPRAYAFDPLPRQLRTSILNKLHILDVSIIKLEADQAASGVTAADNQTIQSKITPVYVAVETGDVPGARNALAGLQSSLREWQKKYGDLLRQKGQEPVGAPIAGAAAGLGVPIAMYHYTPANFEAQLQSLQQHGYTTITMHQLGLALHEQGGLPAKPIVITFDDGFSNQMDAYRLLQKYHMRATYYIIMGGPASSWCIGVHRNYSLKCGDGYLNENQIHELDASGIIEIASHTVDHLNLASLPADQQRFQVENGKQQLEALIGHSVDSFAYPYGSYNATTIQIVRDAGFQTAVSTTPGTQQTLSNIFALYRIRDVMNLP